jgi:hypothetical protein
MQISGTGIATFTAYAQYGYRPLTRLAISWRQSASGLWVGTDRGSGADVYESKVRLYGNETSINQFIQEIYYGRTNASTDNQVTLGTFMDGEKIFGENVNHTGSITATIQQISERVQNTWKGFYVDVIFRATSVTFVGSTSMPSLVYCEIGAMQDRDYSIKKYDTYDGTMIYQDRRSDAGIFEGVFTLSNANFILMRNYIKSQRTSAYTLSDTFGIDYPFGTRSAGSYPYSANLIEWEDMGFFGQKFNRIRLKFAEVV